ncbi:MAG: methylenetetrahydrofolate--tRNA-(uracil(54)-C(5))-methyltransferase (FADH(2)-oxidizing) TrmFO [Coriobacteriales bacterium]|nr:methylenetetrahydrofolate--tRNA-(uracil(54)-C(5))-methyltransferase (FADH(2)-oxidizing) TrmFO [Coriobacteriales bacterium]
MGDDVNMHYGSDSGVSIIGGGLAGSEAAWQLAERGVAVQLYEMRPHRSTPAHSTAEFAELVCSNSLKSMVVPSAAATLKSELALMGSMVLNVALDCRLPAGQALAVDRTDFAKKISNIITQHPRITVIRQEVFSVADVQRSDHSQVIVATGPLTADALAQDIATLVGTEHLAFFDAAAPIVEADSLDMSKLFVQSRYDKGTGYTSSASGTCNSNDPSSTSGTSNPNGTNGTSNPNGTNGDYLNAALSQQQYATLIQELCGAKKVNRQSFETADLFQACQPVEEIARFGPEALRHGALKPFGLRDPHSSQAPYAVVQLRAENAVKSAYNLVGFQTNLTFAEQERVFRLIPGLRNARFSRFGVMHRNSFIDAPHALGPTLELPNRPSVRFAGQITGTEGYTEAIASGLYAALNCYARIKGKPPVLLPRSSTFGALLAYATDPATTAYQPLHVNYGIMLPLSRPPKKKRLRYEAYSQRALAAITAFRSERADLDFAPAYSLAIEQDDTGIAFASGAPVRTFSIGRSRASSADSDSTQRA